MVLRYLSSVSSACVGGTLGDMEGRAGRGISVHLRSWTVQGGWTWGGGKDQRRCRTPS